SASARPRRESRRPDAARSPAAGAAGRAAAAATVPSPSTPASRLRRCLHRRSVSPRQLLPRNQPAELLEIALGVALPQIDDQIGDPPGMLGVPAQRTGAQRPADPV